MFSDKQNHQYMPSPVSHTFQKIPMQKMWFSKNAVNPHAINALKHLYMKQIQVIEGCDKSLSSSHKLPTHKNIYSICQINWLIQCSNAFSVKLHYNEISRHQMIKIIMTLMQLRSTNKWIWWQEAVWNYQGFEDIKQDQISKASTNTWCVRLYNALKWLVISFTAMPSYLLLQW